MNNKIFLAEDDRSLQILLKTLLEMEGYQVVIAPEQPIDDVVELFNQEQPNVVFLDVHLKHGSGLDILKQIRAQAGGANIRVIMSSGMDVEYDCLSAGADAFLLKPYMPDELFTKLRE